MTVQPLPDGHDQITLPFLQKPTIGPAGHNIDRTSSPSFHFSFIPLPIRWTQD
jgi:hypothetical protein